MGVRFSAPFLTDPGDPASYTVGTGSLPGVKLSGLGIDNPPLSNAEVTERVELCLYFPWPILGRTSLYIYIYIYTHKVIEKDGRDLKPL